MLSQPPEDPYERLFGKSLSPEQVAEAKFNLVSYVKTLIQMDKQHKAWLEQRKHNKPDSQKSGRNEPPEVIH